MAGNKIEKKENPGVICLQNQKKSLIGITLPNGADPTDATNLSLNTPGDIKIKADESITSVSEDAITNICKNTNFTQATSIKAQGRSQYVLEIGDVRAETTMNIVGSSTTIENWKGSKLNITAAGLKLLKGTSSITISDSSIVLTAGGQTLMISAAGINASSMYKVNGVSLFGIFKTI